MTHCRTGCGAEINYKRVHFSSPVDWLDIPMEQIQTHPMKTDVIHDCPNLHLRDDANDYFVNISNVRRGVRLKEGVKVKFDTSYGQRGDEAENVSLV